MDRIFQNQIWIIVLVAVGLFLLLVPILFRRWIERRLGRADAPPSRRSNVHPFPARSSRSGAAAASDVPRSPARDSGSAAAAAQRGEGVNATQGARGDGLTKTEYQENPSPFAIIAEVCSLEPPVREHVEQSYKGMDVRWKLRLGGISEGVERGPVRSVRMYPDSKAAQSCGIYFVVNLEEHPQLQDASKDEAFVIEGTIESVSGMDIDLKNVHKVQKVA